MKSTHTKKYEGLSNGAGKIVCSCGYETPAIDDSQAFTLGRSQKSVEQFFEEHLATVVGSQVETGMVDPGQEAAVTAAQRPPARKSKQEKRA